MTEPGGTISPVVIYPCVFSTKRAAGADPYLADPALRKLVEFFEEKGLQALKDEDRRAQWYDDWLVYQAKHQLYASVLSPKRLSSFGFELDLLRLTRFLEAFAYFSPAHGYSLQVTFLGLFSILMGSNEPLQREAVESLEAGGLLGFGVSEKSHGSDLFGNEFTLRDAGDGQLIADGWKYYIGNSNSASMISVLARKVNGRSNGRPRRAPLALFALRPGVPGAVTNVRKIHTLGVRSAFVGEFEVRGHQFSTTDLIAEGRSAWDAVFGTVTLGKFFLGFGAIGICEHALEEAVEHLRRRALYGRAAVQMPHIRSAMSRAYARLTAMKLYAYRALDYVQAATASERRYLLFNAVQKAKVSIEGVKVTALLSECVGAKGFESDTYLEMALRDSQLIPRLEGSEHINLALTAGFISRYFESHDGNLVDPKSCVAGEAPAGENAYLIQAHSGAASAVNFPPYNKAYHPLMAIPNVRLFARQVKLFSLFARRAGTKRAMVANSDATMALGRCLATIAYGQLVAENVVLLGVEMPMVSALFDSMVTDLTAAALGLASSGQFDAVGRMLLRKAIAIPRTSPADWDFVQGRMAGPGDAAPAPALLLDAASI